VILAEPPPSPGDWNFKLFGFPVRVQVFFWLTTLLLGELKVDLVQWLMWGAAVFLCILLHELGHALVMRANGYQASIVLYSFGGLAIRDSGRFGARRLGPWDEILISLAGPVSGFILAAILALALRFLAGLPVSFLHDSWRDIEPSVTIANPLLDLFVNNVFHITVWWGVINLLPVYPLDGGQIAQQIFVMTRPDDAMRQSLIVSIVVGGAVCAISLLYGQYFVAVLFAWLTYSNYNTLQSYQQGGGWY
jgi:stage IV sporulation protein FB